MVKFSFISAVFLLGVMCFTSACNNDIFGLFGSTNLDKRLEEKNNFTFLDKRGWRTLSSLGDEYSFIVLTDTHIEDGNIYGLEKLKNVIEGSDIKFVVFSGDITQNGAARDIQAFIETADSMGVPCYPVIGNHDIYFDNWTSWKDKIGSTSYRIDADETTLIILDTANAFLGAWQMDWLDRELRSTARHVFVFAHVNIFTENPLDFQQHTSTKERARLVSLLQSRCNAMFTGHLHKRIEREAGNVKYITIEDYRDNRVYCVVSVSSSGISYRFERL